MGYPISRIGDTSDHGGTIITGSTGFDIAGVPVARVGDILACPFVNDTLKLSHLPRSMFKKRGVKVSHC